MGHIKQNKKEVLAFTSVNPLYLFTKALYGRKKGVSPATVTHRIDKGEYPVVAVNGGELIYDEKLGHEINAK